MICFNSVEATVFVPWRLREAGDWPEPSFWSEWENRFPMNLVGNKLGRQGQGRRARKRREMGGSSVDRFL